GRSRVLPLQGAPLGGRPFQRRRLRARITRFAPTGQTCFPARQADPCSCNNQKDTEPLFFPVLPGKGHSSENPPTHHPVFSRLPPMRGLAAPSLRRGIARRSHSTARKRVFRRRFYFETPALYKAVRICHGPGNH